jgi:hypothetical protein
MSAIYTEACLATIQWITIVEEDNHDWEHDFMKWQEGKCLMVL